MHKLVTIAIAAMMTSLFAVMFWSQVGIVATAVAGAKTESYAVTPNPYLPVQRFEPVI